MTGSPSAWCTGARHGARPEFELTGTRLLTCLRP